MQQTCNKCFNTFSIAHSFQPQSFACPNCRTLFVFSRNKQETHQRKPFLPNTKQIDLEIGSIGIFDGINYEVTGFVVKKGGTDTWVEYSLCDPEGNIAYLNEIDGHWMVLRETNENAYSTKHHKEHSIYSNKGYSLFSEIKDCRIVYANGLFAYHLPEGNFRLCDCINPPLIISFEQVGKETTTFIGHYLPQAGVQIAFNCTLPSPVGIGMAQPCWLNIYSFLLIMLGFLVLIMVSSFVIYLPKTQRVAALSVYTDTTNNEYLSPPFVINGLTSSALSIHLNANLDNSWVNADIGLVNEKTNEVRYAWHDVEYYYGTEDGYSWREGSQNEYFNICGVQAGTYHFVVSAKTETAKIQELNFTATQSAYIGRNVAWAIFALLLISAAAGYYAYNFEQKRYGL